MDSELVSRVEAKIRAHPEKSDSVIADSTRNHGRKMATVQVAEIRRGMGKAGERAQAVEAAAPVCGKTFSIESAIQPHDKVALVLGIVKGIPAGQLMADDTVRKEIGVGGDRWRAIRGSTRLSGLWYKMPDGTLVWGQKATVAQVEARIREVL